MKTEEKDMQFLKTELDRELEKLRLDGNAKRQILQKMKHRPAVQPRYGKWAATVLSAVALLLYGVTHLSHEDLTDAPRMLAQPEITQKVQVDEREAYHAVVYSCTLHENGTLWLRYDVNRDAEKSAPVQADSMSMAFGYSETDASVLQREQQEIIRQWVPFNGKRRSGLDAEKVKNVENTAEAVYIRGFSMLDEADKVLAVWLNDGHSLFENGVVLSSFTSDEAGAQMIRDRIATGETRVRLQFEEVCAGSTIYTQEAGTAEETDGIIRTEIYVE